MPTMLLLTEAVPILQRDRIKKTEKESKHWEKRRRDNETEFVLYRYGSAHLTGLSNRICAWQTTPIYKIKKSLTLAAFLAASSITPGK
jgi:hypothetical protein